MPSKTRLLANLIKGNTGDIDQSYFDELVDKSISPETLSLAVDVLSAGHEGDWVWSWDATSSLPYARDKITNENQSNVPVYKKGTYSLKNFAAYSTYGAATQPHKIFLKWIDEPGSANLVPWVTYDSAENQFFDGVRSADSGTRVQTLNFNVPESITLPTLNTSTVNYNVSVADGQFYYTGIAKGSGVNIGPLRKGNTYNFILDSSVSGHPFYLATSTSNYVSAAYANEYTNGVINSRADSGTVTFVVPNDAPGILYYQCGVHQSMGGNISIKNLQLDSTGSGNLIVYWQHTQEGHAVPSEIKEVPQIVSQMCLAWDATLGKFVPQDLNDYMNKTPSFTNRITREIESRSIDSSGSLSLIDSAYIVSRVGDTGTDSAAVISLIDSRSQLESHTTLVQDGALSVLAGTARWYAPRNITIKRIRGHLGTSATGASVEITIKKNGSSITTLSIPDGLASASSTGLNLSVNEADYITVDITQIGSTVAGSDLNLVLNYQ